MKSVICFLALCAPLSGSVAQPPWYWTNPFPGAPCQRGAFLRSVETKNMDVGGLLLVERTTGEKDSLALVSLDTDESGVFLGWNHSDLAIIIERNGIVDDIGCESVLTLRCPDGSQLTNQQVSRTIRDPNLPCMDDVTGLGVSTSGGRKSLRLDSLASIQAMTKGLNRFALSIGLGAAGSGDWVGCFGIELSFVSDPVVVGARYTQRISTSINSLGPASPPIVDIKDVAALYGVVLNRDPGVSVFSVGPGYQWGVDKDGISYDGPGFSLDLRHHLSKNLGGICFHGFSVYSSRQPTYAIFVSFVL